MCWLSRLLRNRSNKDKHSKFEVPTISSEILLKHNFHLTPELDSLCCILDQLSESNLTDNIPGQFYTSKYFPNEIAAKINPVADKCYRAADYSSAQILYTLQIKMLLIHLITRFHFGRSHFKRDFDSALILACLSSAYFNRANAFDEMNTYTFWQMALDDYEKSLNYGNSEPWDVYFNRGLVYEKMGNIEKARINFHQSLQGAPVTAETRVKRALARLERGL